MYLLYLFYLLVFIYSYIIMTSQQIKTTVKYLGGTYSGYIEPYPGSASGDSSSVEANHTDDELKTKISELIQLTHEYNLNNTKIKNKLGKCALTSAATNSGSTAVNTVLSEECVKNVTTEILTQLDELIKVQNKIINNMKKIFKDLNISDQNKYMKNNDDMLKQYTQRIRAFNPKTVVPNGGNTTFNKRRHSRHLMPSLKKRKHSFTRRKHK